jgi:hypothetical protein
VTGERDDRREPVGLDESAKERTVLLRRGLCLEYATLGRNVVGIGVTVLAALAERSVAVFDLRELGRGPRGSRTS